MILVIWFLVSVSYYGVFTWMPAKLMNVGPASCEAMASLVFRGAGADPQPRARPACSVEAWGRKPTLISFCLLSAAGVPAVRRPPGSISPNFGASLLIASFALLGTWGALCTIRRNSTRRRCGRPAWARRAAVARLGGLLAPSLVALVVSEGLGNTIGLFTGFLVVSALAAVAVD